MSTRRELVSVTQGIFFQISCVQITSYSLLFRCNMLDVGSLIVRSL